MIHSQFSLCSVDLNLAQKQSIKAKSLLSSWNKTSLLMVQLRISLRKTQGDVLTPDSTTPGPDLTSNTSTKNKMCDVTSSGKGARFSVNVFTSMMMTIIQRPVPPLLQRWKKNAWEVHVSQTTAVCLQVHWSVLLLFGLLCEVKGKCILRYQHTCTVCGRCRRNRSCVSWDQINWRSQRKRRSEIIFMSKPTFKHGGQDFRRSINKHFLGGKNREC